MFLCHFFALHSFLTYSQHPFFQNVILPRIIYVEDKYATSLKEKITGIMPSNTPAGIHPTPLPLPIANLPISREQNTFAEIIFIGVVSRTIMKAMRNQIEF